MSSRSEWEWVRWLARSFAPRRREVRRGIGDDSALLGLAPGQQLLTSSDLLVEEVDFLRSRHGPGLLGEKALEVNLSDIAACAGRPFAYMVSLAFGNQVEDAWVEGLFRGMAAAAKRNGCDLIGGDLSATAGPVCICLTVFGAVDDGRSVGRCGARAGDRVVVTGTLGKSATGLNLLDRFPPPQPLDDVSALEQWCNRLPLGERGAALRAACWHLAPQAATAAGQELATLGATAMIDLSDGLSSDLGHICDASGVGIVVDEESLPVDACTQLLDQPLATALHGGEEYELAATVPPTAPLPPAVGGRTLHVVGSVSQETGLRIRRPGGIETLERLGYQHF